MRFLWQIHGKMSHLHIFLVMMNKFFAISISLICTFLTGCSTLTTPKQIQSKIIETHRSNITTSPQISGIATAILLSSGLNQDECMMAFDECLTKVKEVLALNNPSHGTHLAKPTLAFLAELYYAKALDLDRQEGCQIARPPIDPNYTNAPLLADEQATKTTELHACLYAKRQAIKSSIAHSYGYVFYDNLTGANTASALVNESDIKAQDLYHVASNALISEIYKQHYGAFANAQQHHDTHDKGEYGHILANRYQTDDLTINLYLADDPIYQTNLDNGKEPLLSDLVSAYDSRLAHLDTTSTRMGLGVPYVGVLSDRQTFTIKEFMSQTQDESAPSTSEPLKPDVSNISSRIHPMGHLLLTGVVKPQGNTLNEVLSTDTLNVHFFNPYNTREVKIGHKNYPLSANFSAGYALWLAENQLQQVSILNMLDKNTATLPQLFMLNPYDPNQRVIIMIHGLASSPATWVNLTNNLFADPTLQENYQVWQIFYATNLPMLENRHQIRELISTAYTLTDPQGTNPASHHSVIIGHSMGGIMARMLVSDEDLLPRLQELENSDEITQSQEPNNQSTPESMTPPKINERLLRELLKNGHHDNLQSRLTLTALPQVDTAVFISAPFAGTDYAERWFTRFARRVVRLPLDITKTATNLIIDGGRIDESELQSSFIGSLYLQNGPSQLSDRSEFMKLTKEISINDKVIYHTIMGDSSGSAEGLQGSLVGKNLSDGIVPYDSSHLDGAMSETIITGGHNIHENPKTILQLRKILHEHLERHDIKK